MEKMDQIPPSDRDKIQDDYYHYERLVRDARYDIEKHLNLLRQREADQTGGVRYQYLPVPHLSSQPT